MPLKTILVLTILMLIFGAALPMVSADDPAIGSKEDNACNAEGLMAGKCDSAWHWICGWYVAHWESAGGWSTPNNSIPDWCAPATTLPPRPVVDNNPTTGGAATCLASPVSNTSIIYYGPINTPGNVQWFNGKTCSSPAIGPLGVIIAADAPTSMIQCPILIPGTNISVNMGALFPGFAFDQWLCYQT